MKRIALSLGFFITGVASTAHANIPAGYMGKPFDPAVAGGPMLPAGVKAGPYPLPGRLELENHDMGGLNVAYFTADHIKCGAPGYRIDDGTQEASLCLTSSMPDAVYSAPKGDVWFDTGSAALDGTTYPSATTTSVYIGAVRPGDWVNITVDVQTAGTYEVGSTWASGNGPLGREGGNGAMELQVFVNGTMELDWKDTFPNYLTTANFHNWKPYPNMGTVQLQGGIQVIKLGSGADPHLNLDYVQFSLVLPDGGLDEGDGSTGLPGTTGSDAAAEPDAPASADGSPLPPQQEGGSSGAGADAAVGGEAESAGGMDAAAAAAEAGSTGGSSGCTVSAGLGGQPFGEIAAALAILGLAFRRRTPAARPQQ
jgi:hypothetical protein